MNTFEIYDGSYQIDRIQTDKHIDKDYAKCELFRNIEYNSKGDYWCSVRIGDIETRYRIYNNKFEAYKVIDWSKIN